MKNSQHKNLIQLFHKAVDQRLLRPGASRCTEEGGERAARGPRSFHPHPGFDAKRTCLLLIDVQNYVWNAACREAASVFESQVREVVLPNLRRLIDAFRGRAPKSCTP